MQQGTQAIYTMPGSKIKTLTELKGHLLGINAPLNINYLLAASVLTENGIRLTQVRFPTAPIPFPTMAAALAAGKIDAAAMPEPFATAAEQQYGAVRSPTSTRAPPSSSPSRGTWSTKSWARAEPGHAAGVPHRAVAGPGDRRHQPRRGRAGHGGAAAGRRTAQIPPIVAAVMAVNIYPTAIDKVRIQRVADVMYQFGLLRSRFNVTPMIGP